MSLTRTFTKMRLGQVSPTKRIRWIHDSSVEVNILFTGLRTFCFLLTLTENLRELVPGASHIPNKVAFFWTKKRSGKELKTSSIKGFHICLSLEIILMASQDIATQQSVCVMTKQWNQGSGKLHAFNRPIGDKTQITRNAICNRKTMSDIHPFLVSGF